MRHCINRIFDFPPHIIVHKALFKTLRSFKNYWVRTSDLKKGTYCCDLSIELDLQTLIMPVSAVSSMVLLPVQKASVTKYYLEHRFDLLGSGWVRVYHGMKYRGLEGYRYDIGEPVNVDEQGRWLDGRINSSNLTEAQRIWKMVDPGYIPIDWHIDFKSGYRWSEKTWYKNIKYGHKLGVDVKVPWELARMQHLPQMALAFQSFPEESEERKRLQREFRNQVLDFIATNPPRFGVNWACPMDVSIRAANWLMAYDLICVGGAHFDDEFENVFTRSIYEHGLHIVNNLEWHNLQRGNHYLADIVGLAFIAAYLPSTVETDAWLVFSVQELVTEVGYQFYRDGCNFEGSTAYHRLSAEMVYFATALILGLAQERQGKLMQYDNKALKTGWGKPKLDPAPLPFCRLPEGSRPAREECPFPAWYFERMERMAEFIMDITKPNGHIPQIGDNDSGRFFKLGSRYERMTVKKAKETYVNLEGYSELLDDADYFMEDHLDCSHLVAAAYGLFGRTDFATWLGGQEKTECMPDCFTIRHISNGAFIGSQRYSRHYDRDHHSNTIGTTDDVQKALSSVRTKRKEQVRIKEFAVPRGNLCEGLLRHAYPDFGLYLYKSSRIYLAVRCWSGREPYLSGHMHHDQLSVELIIDGKELVTDPGTFIYTALPRRRNDYRSVKAHFTPSKDLDDFSILYSGLFVLKNITKGTISLFMDRAFHGSLRNSHEDQRMIILSNNKIQILDYNKYDEAVHFQENKKIILSPGYGLLIRKTPDY